MTGPSTDAAIRGAINPNPPRLSDVRELEECPFGGGIATLKIAGDVYIKE
jgi:hypothetical protein